MNSVEKYSQPLVSFNDLPTPQQKRSCTDVFCLIVGLIYSLIIIAIAAILFSKSTFMSVNFPTDSDGKLCGYDLPQYQYVYFAAAPSIAARVCVSKCPTKGDLSLSCKPNSVITSCNFSPLNKYTDSVAEQTRYGFFCWPVEKALTTKIKEAAHILVRQDFFQSLDAVKITLVAALCFSVALVVFVQCFPTCVNYGIVVVSAIALVFAVVLVFAFRTDEAGMRSAIGLILVVILVILAVSVYKNSISIKIHGIFLNYASKIISRRLGLLTYIVLYLVLLILLIGLVILEFVGFWSGGRKIFLPAEYIYYKLEGLSVSSLLAVVLVVQLVWGTAFLKQSFNFCLSGNAIAWYFQSEKEEKGLFSPLCLQIRYHFGSVIACSFMTSFFSLFDFLFDIIKPVHQTGLYAQCFAKLCSCLVCLWDLVRSDSMTMVALTGNPFCNSARYCQYLCNKTPLTEYSQSVNRIYSLASHFFIVGLAIIFSILFTNNKSIFALLLIIVGTLTVATFFISLHADIAESIQIIYLMEQEFSSREKGQGRHKIQGLGMTKYHSDLGQQIQALFTKEKQPNPGIV